ncbi:snaclec GPIB-binding protein subunit beta-like [Drosophila hydei]|uniref:Snaclec GPIB-binding protein subunit beta-like n=1 Tax=Drosophila hydei TaxID=7224 RepID=A0A6J2T0K0_DROHY|nr:snaclec GPIB-binding protein subunit beta-like [Drosophila hydei]
MFRLLLLICCLHLWNCQISNEKYIVASFGKVNWFNANQICHQNDMILATVTSYEQHLLVLRSIALNGHLLGHEGFWLGASNLGDLNSWTWQGLGIPLGYKKWANNEPQVDFIGHEACMVMGLDQSWYSVDCYSEYYFICQRPSNSANDPLYI